MKVLRALVLLAFSFMNVFAGAARPASPLPQGNKHAKHAVRSRDYAGAEQRAARYFESVRRDPALLLAFMQEMPKGGDLHNHLSGAVYAESYVRWASEAGLCLDRQTFTLIAAPCDGNVAKPAAATALADPAFYAQVIDAWSMRDWSPARESGHDHFFATFPKFELISDARTGDMLAEVSAQAARDHLAYLELMFAPDQMAAIGLASRMEHDNEEFARDAERTDFDGMRRALLPKMDAVLKAGRQNLDEYEARMRQDLRCRSAQADAGCRVTVRYLYQVLRGLTPAQVFAQILTGFEMATRDTRVVGFNLVMPEDWHVPMRDFSLHMRMIDFLRRSYPKVHIALHAGELSPGMVPPEGLSFHIRESVEVGHAERIGHGVDVVHERDPLGLLREMAARKVAVEICLTSNDVILGVRGMEHPLPMYLRYQVPVALATDDPGVSRSDMTREYVRAAGSYGVSYGQLKAMARESLEHSFLPGASLWRNLGAGQAVSSCAGKALGASPSTACARFLEANERARVQWLQEGEFVTFERQF
jgi:adenosine deaminase